MANLFLPLFWLCITGLTSAGRNLQDTGKQADGRFLQDMGGMSAIPGMSALTGGGGGSGSPPWGDFTKMMGGGGGSGSPPWGDFSKMMGNFGGGGGGTPDLSSMMGGGGGGSGATPATDATGGGASPTDATAGESPPADASTMGASTTPPATASTGAAGGSPPAMRRRLISQPPLTMSPNNIASRWKLLSGSNHWSGMLNPLDSDLQKYAMIYGSLVQGAYDNFNMISGETKYPMADFFTQAGMIKGNPFKYTVVKYLYASTTPFPEAAGKQQVAKDSTWIGFMAVTTDEGTKTMGRRDIAIAFRGTMSALEWGKDFDGTLVPGKSILGSSGSGMVHHGFLTMYMHATSDSRTGSTSLQQQVAAGLQNILPKYASEEVSITVTGHSLGAALSTVCGVEIAGNGRNAVNGKKAPVFIINYGGPRVGDRGFKQAVNSMADLRVLRVVNQPDPVPKVPPEGIFTHIGEALNVNNMLSPHLILGVDVGSLHLVEPAYLHPLSIANGAKNLRSLACVNKLSGSLNPTYMIPMYWWFNPMKPLVQQEDGSWVLKYKMGG